MSPIAGPTFPKLFNPGGTSSEAFPGLESSGMFLGPMTSQRYPAGAEALSKRRSGKPAFNRWCAFPDRHLIERAKQSS